MPTLVTGGTGLVGNNVVRMLLDQGEQVRVLARQAGAPRPFSGLNVEIVPGDVRDGASVRSACKGVDYVIHAAARVHIGWTGLAEQRATNVEGTRNIVAAVLAEGARLVHVSSVDALGWGSREEPANEDTPPSTGICCPYVITKREAEQEILAQVPRGLNAVIVNPAFMLGPWDWKPSSGRMLLEIGRGKGVLAPPGGNDFCDVRDVAQGILSAATRGVAGRRYILGGESLSYFEAWRVFARVAGKRAPLGVARRWMVRAAGLAGNFWRILSGREPDLNSAAAEIAVLPHHFSSGRAQQELGYSRRPVDETVSDAWDWFRQQGYC